MVEPNSPSGRIETVLVFYKRERERKLQPLGEGDGQINTPQQQLPRWNPDELSNLLLRIRYKLTGPFT